MIKFSFERRKDMRKKRGGLLFDVIMTFLTGGLWLIWLLIKFFRHNS